MSKNKHVQFNDFLYLTKYWQYIHETLSDVLDKGVR